MQFRIPIYYSEIFGINLGEEGLGEILAQFEKTSTFQTLAAINSLLSFYDRDKNTAGDVQDFLFANFTDEGLYEMVKKKFPHEQMANRPIFHRWQLLALMKRILCKEVEGLLNPDVDAAARYKLGEACLIQNDVLNPEELNRRLEEATNKDLASTLSELFLQLIVSFELFNPAEDMYAIARSDEFCNLLERRSLEYKFSNGESVPERFAKLTGLSLRHYLWMIFCVCVVYKYESKSLPKLLEEPAKRNIRKSTIFSNTNLSQEEVNAFFRLLATDITTFGELMRSSSGKPKINQDYEYTAFRTYPLYYLDDKQDVLSVIDFTFLTEKLSAGVFHTISNSIRENENKDWHTFSGFWGKIFDEYVNDRLREAFPLWSQRLYTNPFFDRMNEEAFDSVIDYGDSLIVMEHKGTYLAIAEKYSGQSDLFLKGIEKNIGKGIKQLAEKLAIVFADSTPDTFSQRDASGATILFGFSNKDSGRVEKIYPIIIVQDFAFQIGLANYQLRLEFEREIQKHKYRRGVSIMPLSLLVVEDIEKVIPYLNEISLTAILDEYVSASYDPIYTFQNVLYRVLRERNIQQRPNEWVLNRRREINQLIKEQFKLS